MIELLQSHFGLTAEDSFPAPKWYFQQVAWVRNPRHPENLTYNYPLALRMRGVLDKSALERSLQEIVRRHQPLRSVFRISEGRLMQVVLPPQPLPLPVVDLSNVRQAEREAEALRLAVADANRPFDLGHGPLLRAKLWRLGPEDHLLLLTTHHIVSDNLSMAILLRELSLVYGAFSAGEPSPLPDISFQYGDFVRRQQKRFEHKEKELEYIAFWQQQLAGRDGFHYVPPDHVRPQSQTYRGAHERLTLDESLTNSLKTLGVKEKVSPFMVLLAALQCLLCRYSGQQDIGVASCVANRQSPQVEKLVGHFSNHVIFRASLADNPTFREVLRQVRKTALTAYSYQDLPFGSLIEQLETSDDRRNNLFQALLVLIEAPKEKWTFSGLDVRPLSLDVGTTAYELIVWLKLEERLEVDLQYNSNLFEVATIRQILEDYGGVLGAVSKNPEARVGELEIVRSQSERDNYPRLEHTQDYVGPKDGIESQLVRLWEAVLGKRSIGIEDDFFELGGTSLLAARLFTQIEETFKLSIPLVTLVQAPTITKLAKVIHAADSSNAWPSLVTIQAGGVRPPLFCIHGESGNLLMYRSLARHLGPDQPVYGLQPQGLNGKQAPLTRIEDMAARYIKEIQVIQPEGPYFLAGYCMGGTIAFEMAQQFSQRGQRVNLLALLDTYNWRMMKRTFLDDLYFNIQKWWFSCGHFSSTSCAKSLSSLQARFHELHTESELSECNRRAAYAYTPRVYPGRMLHVRPSRQYARYNRPCMGWDDLVAGELEVFSVPSHPAQLVEEPFVKDLAIKLRSCISEAIAKENSVGQDACECRHHSLSFSLPSRTAAPKTLCGPPVAVETVKACQ